VKLLAIAVLASACGGGGGSECGPTSGTVARIIDGDTIELETGERIRYLMVNTPETTGGKNECFGVEAMAFNRTLVEGKQITIAYDVECTDQFDRTLAYVTVSGQEVNRLLVERGFACVLHIPPNGNSRADEFRDLEDTAQAENRGLWAQCDPIPCN
jgi:micrococcal nuclease